MSKDGWDRPTNAGRTPLLHEEANGFSPVGPDKVVTVDFYYSKIHCVECKDHQHMTCEHCGFHGQFEEWGDEIHCPECYWGMPT
jgi:threonine dehydrogenase-like Zn-dependent dehydrogenase